MYTFHLATFHLLNNFLINLINLSVIPFVLQIFEWCVHDFLVSLHYVPHFIRLSNVILSNIRPLSKGKYLPHGHTCTSDSSILYTSCFLLLTKRPDITFVAAPVLPGVGSNPPRLVKHLRSCPQRRELRVLVRLTELMAAHKINQGGHSFLNCCTSFASPKSAIFARSVLSKSTFLAAKSL